MRHEQQFASLDALKSQLAADASRARDIVAAAISE
jgi:FAD synthase